MNKESVRLLFEVKVDTPIPHSCYGKAALLEARKAFLDQTIKDDLSIDMLKNNIEPLLYKTKMFVLSIRVIDSEYQIDNSREEYFSWITVLYTCGEKEVLFLPIFSALVVLFEQIIEKREGKWFDFHICWWVL